MVLKLAARAALVLSLGVLCGCHTMLRYKPVEPGRAPSPVAEVAGTLNPYVLTGLASKRLVVEVDWIAGNEPSAYALDGLRARLAEYVSAGREVRVEKGEEIPADEWPAGLREDRMREVMDRHLTHDPGGTDQVVYILYVSRFHGHFGFSSEWPVTRAGRTTLVGGCVVCMEAARKQAFLWISARKIERATLVHEFGHVLGLVRNPRHEQAGDPVHCTHTECLMGHPRPRTIVANFFRGFFTGRLPGDYCRACRDDIRRAHAYWAAQAAADPRYGERLVARQRARDLTWMADEAARGDADGTAPDPARAEALYREALALDAWADGARFQLARALVSRGRIDEAVALARDGAPPAAVSAAGPDAVSAAESASEPWDARSRVDFAMDLCAVGRYADAASMLDAIRRRRLPPHQQIWAAFARGWALSGTGREREAADALAAFEAPSRAYARYEATVHRVAASAYRRAGDLARAAALVEEGRASCRVTACGDPDAWSIEAGRIAWARGDAPGARAAFLAAAAEAERAIAQAEEGTGATMPNAARTWSRLRALARAAHAHALAGDAASARERLSTLHAVLASEAEDDRAGYENMLRPERIRALAVLGDYGAAARDLAATSAADRSVARFDPCLDDDLASWREAGAGFAEAAPWCGAGAEEGGHAAAR